MAAAAFEAGMKMWQQRGSQGTERRGSDAMEKKKNKKNEEEEEEEEEDERGIEFNFQILRVRISYRFEGMKTIWKFQERKKKKKKKKKKRGIECNFQIVRVRIS
jgi:hypothetical protein